MNITALCMSSTIQRTVVFGQLHMNEVNRSARYRLDASGKAVNAARVLNQLEKGCVVLICPAGKENIAEFASLAKQDGLTAVLISVPGRVRECCTLLEKKGARATELVMDEPELDDKASGRAIVGAEKQLMRVLKKALKKTDAFLFAGSSPAIWPADLKVRICKQVCDAGITLLVDFWGKELLSVLEVCTPSVIKINAKEFCDTFCAFDTKAGLSGQAAAGLGELGTAELSRIVCEKSCELKNCIVVTRGKDSTIAAFKGSSFAYPVEAVKVVNPIGCGDSFSAGFLYEYIKTSFSKKGEPDIAAALVRGTYCAARNAECEKVGSLYES